MIYQENWELLASRSGYRACEMAKLCCVSLRTLQRHFRSCNLGVHAWLQEVRLREAYRRVVSGEPIKCIAYDLGYKQLSHFSRQFKDRFGAAPSALSGEKSQIAELFSGVSPDEFICDVRESCQISH